MNNDFEGVYLDDLEISLGCPELASCDLDTDCDDDNPCTVDVCSPKGCAHKNICEETGSTPGNEGVNDPAGGNGDDPAGGNGDDPAGGNGDDPAGGNGDDPAGGNGDDPAGGNGDDPAGGNGDDPAGGNGDDPAGGNGDDPAGGNGDDPAGGNGDDPAGGNGDDPAGGNGDDPAGGDGGDNPSETDPTAPNPCEEEGAPDNCCTSHEECDDGNFATINTCEGATCTSTPNPDACQSDGECNDGEACTTDTCVGGLCQFDGDAGAFCCEPEASPLADFDSGNLDGFYVTDNLEMGMFWNVDPTRSTSGQFSLYFGDPVSQTYGTGKRVKSSATTPLMTLPVGGDTALTFDLFKATRPIVNYDVLQVFVLRKGALIPVWSSKSLPDGTTTGAFQSIEVPLSGFSGQSIQLRIVFDSVDGPSQPLEGIYIDSLKLETGC
jgi:hypothetical protein